MQLTPTQIPPPPLSHRPKPCVRISVQSDSVLQSMSEGPCSRCRPLELVGSLSGVGQTGPLATLGQSGPLSRHGPLMGVGSLLSPGQLGLLVDPGQPGVGVTGRA
ncbi:hypothetical protein BV22DRAFT_898338 [Leucogyrophana mollusca]|uniref:Uncharacterized protein n=1 Tax=Leucogyrophana mollusca TaxID=85980 RepID=A0ACB8AZD0_9AGAM|nr:hypothetical protein BV22DRAFT_898338 [Leucogyrophana mollusca]